MDYQFKPTTHGRSVLAACMALSASPDICRVSFGSGRIDEETNLADVHELLEYVADGAIADRHHEDDHFYFTIQYSNYANQSVKTFYLSEFIVYIKDPETGEETDLLYGTLGDYRLPVPQFHNTIPPSVFDLPLVVVISDDVTVEVSAPPGLVTYEDLTKAVKKAMDETATGTNVIPLEITIPTVGWSDGHQEPDGDDEEGAADIEDAYGGLWLDIPISGVTDKMVPFLSMHPESLSTAKSCELSNSIQTLKDTVRVYAKAVPSSEIKATLTLIVPPTVGGNSGGMATDGYVLLPATKTRLGGIKGGSGLNIEPDGTASVDWSAMDDTAAQAVAEKILPSEAEVDAMLDAEFQPPAPGSGN